MIHESITNKNDIITINKNDIITINKNDIITNDDISYIRKDNISPDTYADYAFNKKTSESDVEDSHEFNINIYRYKFSKEFTSELYIFSKIHQYDHRTVFKEAWNIWIEENDILVNEEIMRLTNLAYSGDILNKMFKSARYYFRKKSTEKKTPQKRRVYLGVQTELLESMDSQIKREIKKVDYTPADGFDAFCNENIELLKEEVGRLLKCGIKDSNEIKNKVKKTYKNRYFLFTNK